ncbi:MAG: sugar kinase [Hyphomonadaceae bacterium]|nr:sugar kinase [Hyphomonadaceae bacterium]
MKDLRADLLELHRQLSQTPATDGGRSVMFMAARSGEGVSSVAASFALMAAEHARKPVWLVDLDLKRNHLFNTFAVGPFANAFGGVGPPYSASLKTQPFFTIEPDDPETTEGLGLFTAHRVGQTRLMVTQFDASRVKKNHAIRIRTQPAYWQTVRAATDWAVVDAPALELAGAGLAIASQMDRCVIVVRADETTPGDVDAVRREIESHGGRVAGVVMNRVRNDARFIDRLAQ